ncbi:unnamed protein product [Cyprideis torosa]|uniref:Uncharacterized protein n=1 Tax=Cyprideis torosa TaxID=163714 RepID=A0A7R8ZT37_9CRUS|nr:unnamed protein product [Cyprideis torosa]CAG0907613.1 unnamed protein product [Cyprideis torosa]
MKALLGARERELKEVESEEDSDENDGDNQETLDVQGAVKQLSQKLEQLATCQDVVLKHSNGLLRSISDLDAVTVPASAPEGFSETLRQLKERTTLFRITMTAALEASSEFVALSEKQGKKWERLLRHEQDQKFRLEEMVSGRG